MQSATTVYGQVDELRMAVESLSVPRGVLMGIRGERWLRLFGCKTPQQSGYSLVHMVQTAEHRP
jgi:hypothetical protein